MAQNVKGTVRASDTGEALLGASVYWLGTNIGMASDLEGKFDVYRVKGYDKLVAAYVGYKTDTITVAEGVTHIDFSLQTDNEIEAVVVDGNLGNYVKRDGVIKSESISFAGLCKMACCTLAESFENSASVTVGYSDAISGARQIKMLGLTGTYTQILDENRPIMRGLSAPYGLNYTPGMWLNSIQVSKGVSSVTAGHEAITGQINMEYRKPTDEERLFLNLYFDSEMRPEINLSTAIPLTADKSLSTVILVHGSMDTQSHDRNHDGYRDLPETHQINIANRWLWQSKGGTQIRWGWKYVDENRLSGENGYKHSMREEMERSLSTYGSNMDNSGVNAYLKFGKPVGAAVYDTDSEEEYRSNIVFVADYNYFKEKAYFGLNDYNGHDHAWWMKKLYPQLRSVRFDFHLHRAGMIKDTVHTTELDTVYMTGLQALKDMEYKTAVTILRPYDDYNSALAFMSADYNHSALDVLGRLDDGDPKVCYLKAIVLMRLGQEEEAMKYFELALAYDPYLEYRANLDPEMYKLVNKYKQL